LAGTGLAGGLPCVGLPGSGGDVLAMALMCFDRRKTAVVACDTVHGASSSYRDGRCGRKRQTEERTAKLVAAGNPAGFGKTPGSAPVSRLWLAARAVEEYDPQSHVPGISEGLGLWPRAKRDSK
jgi:hypothetical protein